jgi:excisionase family DNA binding protein
MEPRPTYRWMTCEEVAQRSHVSRQTIERLVKGGELTAYRFGNALRFDFDEVRRQLRHRSHAQKGGDVAWK